MTIPTQRPASNSNAARRHRENAETAVAGDTGVEGVALRVLGAHEYMNGLKRGTICVCGFVPTVDAASLNSQQDYHRAHVAAALADALGDDRRVVAAESGLAVAERLLRQVVDYWDGRPLTHHGDHIHADLCDVLRAITPTTEARP